MKGVFLFEALHGDTDNYIQFVTGRLEADLKALESARRSTGVFDSDIFKAQAAYLQNGLHVVAFGGGAKGYKERTLAIRTAVLKWWEKNAKRLKDATDPHTVLLDTLWAHYQAQYVPGLDARERARDLGQQPRPRAGLAGEGRRARAGRATRQGDGRAQAAKRGTCAVVALSGPGDRGQGGREEQALRGHRRAVGVRARDHRRRPGVPADWLSNFKSTTFLGKSVGEPIHADLVAHLKTVETSFAKKYGDGDPAVAGQALGLHEDVIGSRHAPTSAALSMHLFGLAIDVNYATNPFISASANVGLRPRQQAARAQRQDVPLRDDLRRDRRARQAARGLLRAARRSRPRTPRSRSRSRRT